MSIIFLCILLAILYMMFSPLCPLVPRYKGTLDTLPSHQPRTWLGKGPGPTTPLRIALVQAIPGVSPRACHVSILSSGPTHAHAWILLRCVTGVLTP
jgi:hypothetical protein